jgi:hypothetical protein
MNLRPTDWNPRANARRPGAEELAVLEWGSHDCVLAVTGVAAQVLYAEAPGIRRDLAGATATGLVRSAWTHG